ncbi:MAG: hypothetical protein R3300_20500, partial [Candidatus Promineifilaceae bacterium]|nr:hypothetical protein [Candidatus Promineifilaceae bacterium]
MPTLFDGLEIFAFLRGWPAAYLLALTAGLLFVIRDWRGAVLVLSLQYLLVGLVFVDVLVPRLAFVKV